MASKSRGRGKPRARQDRIVSHWNQGPRASDLQAIYELWRRVNGAVDIGWTPDAIIELIRPFHAQTSISEVIDGGRDHKSHSAGAQWKKLHGYDFSGMLLSQGGNREARQRVGIIFGKALVDNRPAFVETPQTKRSERRGRALEMIYLPLIGVQGIVTHFIAAIPLT